MLFQAHLTRHPVHNDRVFFSPSGRPIPFRSQQSALACSEQIKRGRRHCLNA